MALYEHVFIARQEIAQTQVDQLITQFKELVASQGGKVGRTEYWGLKPLSYRIRKNRKGHYILMDLDAPAAAVTELERQLRLHEDILRYLTVRVDAHEEGASAMLQSRGRDRDDRDRGDRRGGFRERGERGDRDRGDRGPRGDRPREPRSEA